MYVLSKKEKINTFVVFVLIYYVLAEYSIMRQYYVKTLNIKLYKVMYASRIECNINITFIE